MRAFPSPVCWTELKPDEFRQRLNDRPIVYLPLGLCEPHGHAAALGLDLIKAEYYCGEAARRFGGIVAPSQGYHIHECGFHAPWLAEVVGEENAMMAALPPQVMVTLFLYQLRAFANSGFQAVVAISGHAGGSQEDLRMAATAFTARTGLPVDVRADPELVAGRFRGDHAGRYELSQLLAIRPDLVDLGLLSRKDQPGSGGRLAAGEDAAEATAAEGTLLNEAIIDAIGLLAAALLPHAASPAPRPLLTYADVEQTLAHLPALPLWASATPRAGQAPVDRSSRWKPYEFLA